MGITEDDSSDLQISFLMQKLAQRKVSENWEESGDYRPRAYSVPLSSCKEHVEAPAAPPGVLECFSTVKWKKWELFFHWQLIKACFLLSVRSNYNSCEISYAAFWEVKQL